MMRPTATVLGVVAIVAVAASCESKRGDTAPAARVQEPTQTTPGGAVASEPPSVDSSKTTISPASAEKIEEAAGVAAHIVEESLEDTRDDTVPVAFASGVALVPGDNAARHPHLGPPATLGLASYIVRNHDDRRHVVRAIDLEFLRGDCRSKMWDETIDLEPVAWMRGPSRSELEDVSTDTYSLSPGEAVRLWSTHQTLRAFQRCDRFAYRLALEVDGSARLEGVLPVRVMRLSHSR